MRKPYPILILPILILATALLSAASAMGLEEKQRGSSAPQQQPTDLIGSAKAPLSPREADYVRIVARARQEYAASRSVDARRNSRLNFQIAVHDFMGLSHDATDWVGVFRDSKKTHDGMVSLEIEIAPGVTISTFDNAEVDVVSSTLLKPYMPTAKVVENLAIGDTVIFTANLIGSVISTDDDMVLHPQIIAQFTRLSKLDDPQK